MRLSITGGREEWLESCICGEPECTSYGGDSLEFSIPTHHGNVVLVLEPGKPAFDIEVFRRALERRTDEVLAR